MPKTETKPAVPVLIVEPDPLLAEMLLAALRLHRAELEPVLAGDPEQALALAEARDFELVLAEIGLPSASAGQVFLARLARVLPRAPVLVLSESSIEALSALLDFDVAVVTKPPDIDHLLRRVDQLLERRGGSLVQEISLASLLQMLESERKTCRIAASSKLGEGRLWLEQGRLVHAQTSTANGVEALFEVLGWREPVLRIVSEPSPERSIHRELRGLLLHFCVEQDHRRRDLGPG